MQLRITYAKLILVTACLLALPACDRKGETPVAPQAGVHGKETASAPTDRKTTVTAAPEKPRTPLKPEDAQAVKIYRELYSSGVIRPIRFEREADPDQAAREEIHLEAELARRAEETTLSQDRALLADIDYYQGVEILNEWLRRQVQADEITSEAIQAYYDANREKFTRPELVVFHHLFLLVPPSDAAAEKQKQEQIEKLHRQAVRGADFERLVSEYSEIPGADKDRGKVGPVPLARLNKTIQEALKDLTEGQISGPVRTAYGWELLRLDERTTEGVVPLQEVRHLIVDTLVLEKAEAIRAGAAQRLQKLYPATANEQLLSGSDPLTSEAVALTIKDRKMTVGELLTAIQATYAYTKIQDERERIRAALPRITLTEQVKEAARQEGLLDTPYMKTKLRLIRNRLLGEQMYKRHTTSDLPTENEVRARYEKDKTTLFRTPPQAKGVLYTWTLPEQDKITSGAELAYRKEILRQKVNEIVNKARSGQMSREELARQADKVTELDWFREGPMGYEHDMAFFKTEPGQFTPLIPQKQGWAVGWVEDRKEPQSLSYETIREQVRKLIIRERSEAERKAMVEEILKHYARGL